jgi:ATP-dependent RNA helicase RhlE
MTFSDLGLEPELLRAVADKGYDTPTPIQAKAIPAVLSGRDVLAGAQTGTGKTAGFVLPLLQKLGAASGRAPRALVLSPTRELTAQIADSARAYGRYKDLRTLVIFGGVSERPQMDGLRSGCDLLVATPGRLIDLVEQGAADLSQVRHLVLDEADRMLDMGFIHAIKRILKMLPAQRQNLMFSATYSDDIRELAGRMLRDPVSVEVAPRNTTAERVEQVAFRVPKEDKRHLLVHLFNTGSSGEGSWHQALVFTRTKHGANRLAQQLEGAGIRAAAIHGNKSQAARVRALEDFKSGRIAALVATEVASRGLDIKELPQVVNYELPNVPEDYVHRIGRTARAGSTGRAVSLVAPDEAGLLRDIERTMRQSVPVLPTPAFERRVPAGPPDRGPPPPRSGARGAERGDARGVSRPNASQPNRGGSAPRPAGHGGPPGSRSRRFGPSRRSRSAF